MSLLLYALLETTQDTKDKEKPHRNRQDWISMQRVSKKSRKQNKTQEEKKSKETSSQEKQQQQKKLNQLARKHLKKVTETLLFIPKTNQIYHLQTSEK